MKNIALFLPYLFLTLFALQGCKKSVLPSLNILKDGAISWDKKEDCTVQYSWNDESIGLSGKVKLRGGHSARYEKNSMSLELKKKYNLAGLPKDDDWILNANYIDKTFMRHKISYDLFSRMGPNNMAAKTDFVDVYLNDQYHGLYTLTEEINANKVGLKKKDPFAMLFKDPPILYPEVLSAPQDTNNYYQQKYPKISKLDHTAYLEEFRTFLFHASPEEFKTGIASWVDVSNIIDWHLLLLLTNNGDGIMKNFYLYKIDAQTPFRIAIWDYDHSFGRDGDNELNMMERPLKWKRSILFTRLMDLENYRNELDMRYKTLRSSGLFSNQNIKDMVKEIDQKIRHALPANFKKWPVNSKWYYDENTYSEEKKVLLDFVNLRLEQLDAEMNYISD